MKIDMYIVQQLQIADSRLFLVEGNFRHAKTWAEKNDLPHLETGAGDLLQRLTKLHEDLSSLISIVRAQNENE
jgi:hypothetical protein